MKRRIIVIVIISLLIISLVGVAYAGLFDNFRKKLQCSEGQVLVNGKCIKLELPPSRDTPPSKDTWINTMLKPGQFSYLSYRNFDRGLNALNGMNFFRVILEDIDDTGNAHIKIEKYISPTLTPILEISGIISEGTSVSYNLGGNYVEVGLSDVLNLDLSSEFAWIALQLEI